MPEVLVAVVFALDWRGRRARGERRLKVVGFGARPGEIVDVVVREGAE
jgi:hypothetical protein